MATHANVLLIGEIVGPFDWKIFVSTCTVIACSTN
jgi:hypothetical protein